MCLAVLVAAKGEAVTKDLVALFEAGPALALGMLGEDEVYLELGDVEARLLWQDGSKRPEGLDEATGSAAAGGKGGEGKVEDDSVLVELDAARAYLDGLGVHGEADVVGCLVVVHAAVDQLELTRACLSWLTEEEVAVSCLGARLDVEEVVKVENAALAARPALGAFVEDGGARVVETRLGAAVTTLAALVLELASATLASSIGGDLVLVLRILLFGLGLLLGGVGSSNGSVLCCCEGSPTERLSDVGSGGGGGCGGGLLLRFLIETLSFFWSDFLALFDGGDVLLLLSMPLRSRTSGDGEEVVKLKHGLVGLVAAGPALEALVEDGCAWVMATLVC